MMCTEDGGAILDEFPTHTGGKPCHATLACTYKIQLFDYDIKQVSCLQVVCSPGHLLNSYRLVYSGKCASLSDSIAFCCSYDLSMLVYGRW